MKSVSIIAFAGVALALTAAAPPRPAMKPSRLAFSPDGQALAVAGRVEGAGAVLELWDVKAGRKRWRVAVPAPAAGLAWAADGKTLLAAAGPAVLLLDPATGATRKALLAQGKAVTALALSGDGRTLATAGDDRSLWLRDWREDAVVRRLAGEPAAAVTLAFSPDDARLVSASMRSGACVYDTATGKRLHQLEHGYTVSGAAFAPGGKEILTAGYDGLVRRWDSKTGDRVGYFHGFGGASGVAVHHATRRMGVWTSHRQFYVFDVNPGPPDAATGKRIEALLKKLDDDDYDTREKAGRDLRAVGFVAEPALREAAEKSPSAEVRIRAREARRAVVSTPLFQPRGHTGGVRHVVFSADGKALASCAADDTVRLWDAATGRQVAVLGR